MIIWCSTMHDTVRIKLIILLLSTILIGVSVFLFFIDQLLSLTAEKNYFLWNCECMVIFHDTGIAQFV